MTNRKLQALLLDVDGTLADTEGQGHRPAYNQAFEALGLDWHWDPLLYRSLLAVPGGRERIAHYMHAHAPALGAHAAAVADDRAAWIDELHGQKTRFFRERLKAGAIPLRPGIARLLRSAGTADVPCALVTNATRASLALMVEHLLGEELATLLTATACGDEVGAKKPAPDLYRLALVRLHADAARCVAIEDAASGLAAAQAAGVVTVVTVNDDTRDQDFADADLVVSDLGEPGAPAQVLSGPTLSGECVTLDTLSALVDLAP